MEKNSNSCILLVMVAVYWIIIWGQGVLEDTSRFGTGNEGKPTNYFIVLVQEPSRQTSSSESESEEEDDQCGDSEDGESQRQSNTPYVHPKGKDKGGTCVCVTTPPFEVCTL